MALKHTHKYERRRLGSWKTKGHVIYKCATPGCGHYMIDLEAVIGRMSQCWGLVPHGKYELRPCDHEVEMTRYLVHNEKRKHPLCEECKERKKQKWAREKEERETNANIDARSAS